MNDTLKAAFLFIAPEADPARDRQWVKTPVVHLLMVGVSTYSQAVAVCTEMVQQDGIGAIELCGGFGHRGTALIVDAVGDRASVGVVRFDGHPGLNNQSGDALFGRP